MTRLPALPSMLVVLAPFYLGADINCAGAPLSDTLVATSTTQVEGVLLDQSLLGVDAEVQLRVNGVPVPPVNTVAARYVFSDVPLTIGANVIDVVSVRQAGETQITSEPRIFRIQRKTDLVDRGTQPYFLDFSDPAYQQQVKDFIALTVNAPLSNDQLNALLEVVNNRIRERFRASYELLGLRIFQVDTPGTPGSEVSTIFFDGANEDTDGVFGRAPLDYRNRNKEQTGRVFMLNVRRFYVDMNALFLGTPALRTDTPERRAIDLGNILSRAAVHELNHTLGLVTEGPQFLDGCDSSHNCLAFDDANPFANRFQSGAFFMDVDRSAAVDFGSASATMRMEFLPVQNGFNFGYLDILH